MGKPPAYQMYAADFAMDTARMTAEQVGCYIRLLNDAWVNGGIPVDPAEMASIAGVTPRRFKASVWPALERCWISDGNGSMLNPRMEAEREKQQRWREKSAKGGRASGKARASQS